MAGHIPSSKIDAGPGSNEGISGLEIDKEKEVEKCASKESNVDRYDREAENGYANETTSPAASEAGNSHRDRSPSQANRTPMEMDSLQQATLQTGLASATAATHEENIDQMTDDDGSELTEPRQKEEMKILPIDRIISSGR